MRRLIIHTVQSVTDLWLTLAVGSKSRRRNDTATWDVSSGSTSSTSRRRSIDATVGLLLQSQVWHALSLTCISHYVSAASSIIISSSRATRLIISTTQSATDYLLLTSHSVAFGLRPAGVPHDQLRPMSMCPTLWCQYPERLLSVDGCCFQAHHSTTYTVEFLIGITWTGSVCFSFKEWDGYSSDDELIVLSGFLDKLTSQNTVTTDRGFRLQDNLGMHQFVVSEYMTKKQFAEQTMNSQESYVPSKNLYWTCYYWRSQKSAHDFTVYKGHFQSHWYSVQLIKITTAVNSLPAELRLSTLSTTTFARPLKTHLFVSTEWHVPAARLILLKAALLINIIIIIFIIGEDIRDTHVSSSCKISRPSLLSSPR